MNKLRKVRGLLVKLGLTLNAGKTRQLSLCQGATFSFLGFEIRRNRTRRGKWGILKTPKSSARSKLLEKIKGIFRTHRSQPLTRVLKEINPILRGWVNYFRVGNSSRCFTYVKDWIEKKVRHHLMQASDKASAGRDGVELGCTKPTVCIQTIR